MNESDYPAMKHLHESLKHYMKAWTIDGIYRGNPSKEE